jgi:hypothetical protein
VNRLAKQTVDCCAKSCQEGNGPGFFQVPENAEKLNLGKCPKHSLRYDILVL